MYKLELFRDGDPSDSSRIYDFDFHGRECPIPTIPPVNKPNVRYAKISLTNDEASVLSISYIAIYGKENIVEKICPKININKEKNQLRQLLESQNAEKIKFIIGQNEEFPADQGPSNMRETTGMGGSFTS